MTNFKIAPIILSPWLLQTVMSIQVYTFSDGYKFVYGRCKTGANGILFTESTRQQCFTRCSDRPDCVSLNYQRRTLMCRLHCGDDTVRHCVVPGIIYSDKAWWNMPARTPDVCYSCAPYQKCTYYSKVNSSCHFEECQTPEQITDGFVQGNLRHIGDKVRYTCNKGFGLHGPSIRTCQSNGIWTGFRPICCPKGWFAFNKGCYYIETNKTLEFVKAKPYCSDMSGAELLFINSSRENKFMKTLLSEMASKGTFEMPLMTFWLDLKLVDYVWRRDSTHEVATWFDWLDGEPNSPQPEMCGSFLLLTTTSIGWGDRDCSYSTYPICELQRN